MCFEKKKEVDVEVPDIKEIKVGDLIPYITKNYLKANPEFFV